MQKFKMRFGILLTLVLAPCFHGFSQEKPFIPQYVMDEFESMTRDGGDWVTIEIKDASGKPIDNEKYGLQWQWGLGKKSVIGDLYVIRDGKRIGSVYQFRVFYHPLQKSLISYQFGSDGTLGVGETWITGASRSENIASFYSPEGNFKVRHVQEVIDDVSHQESYQQNENGEWVLSRKYKWKLMKAK